VRRVTALIDHLRDGLSRRPRRGDDHVSGSSLSGGLVWLPRCQLHVVEHRSTIRGIATVHLSEHRRVIRTCLPPARHLSPKRQIHGPRRTPWPRAGGEALAAVATTRVRTVFTADAPYDAVETGEVSTPSLPIARVSLTPHNGNRLRATRCSRPPCASRPMLASCRLAKASPCPSCSAFSSTSQRAAVAKHGRPSSRDRVVCPRKPRVTYPCAAADTV
jgi:hypothetical protein